MLRKVVKIIIEMIEVGFVLVRFVKGFFGMKDRISCGIVRLVMCGV